MSPDTTKCPLQGMQNRPYWRTTGLDQQRMEPQRGPREKQRVAPNQYLNQRALADRACAGVRLPFMASLQCLQITSQPFSTHTVSPGANLALLSSLKPLGAEEAASEIQGR